MLLKNNFYFEVAHVNYHKRDASNYEQESLAKYCQQKSIKFYVLNTDLLPDHRGNFQAWARDVRYKFFADCVKLNNLDIVLTAHHLDDLLETYLMQEERDSEKSFYGIRDLTNIYDCPVARPLLNYTKSELLEYCKRNHIPYSIDISNLSDNYTRNKIRHRKIENMTKQEKLELKEKIDHKNMELSQTKQRLKNFMIEDNLCLDEIFKLNGNEWNILLNLFLEESKISCRISKKFSKEMLKAIKSAKPNIVFRLNKTKNIVKDYNFLKITDNENVINYSYIMEVPTILENEYFFLDLTENYEQFRIKNSDFPLVIRNQKQGDMSYINNIPKKVSRLFMDWKMPHDLRKRWPLIFNKNNKLVYIIRYYGPESLKANQKFIVKK